MGKETTLFKSEEKKSATEIAQTLRLMADKIDAGSMTLKKGNKDVRLDFPGTMTFELKVEDEQGKRRLKRSFEIELEWVPGARDDDPGTTTIL